MKKIFIVQLLALIFVVNCCIGFEYKIEKYPICSSVTFHTKHYMGSKQEVYRHSVKDHGYCLVKDLFTVDGVNKIILNGYEIDVEVGEAYDLDEVVKKLEVIIKAILPQHEYKCSCLLQDTTFYRGQIVWDVVSGEGIINKINQEGIVPYPIRVNLDSGAVKTFTINGKHLDTDLLPSLYPYKVKIVKE